MTLKIVIATKNHHKVEEISKLCQDISILGGKIHFSSLAEFTEKLGENISAPLEIYHTFKENAQLKSDYYANILHKAVLSDDSGFIIEAIQSPAVYSADWMENGIALAYERINSLLKEHNISPEDKPSASFSCTLCLNTLPLKNALSEVLSPAKINILNEGSFFDKHFFTGEVKGFYLYPPRGENGFGYDSAFIPYGFTKTFGEMNINEKNILSHRRIAYSKLQQWLQYFS